MYILNLFLLLINILGLEQDVLIDNKNSCQFNICDNKSIIQKFRANRTKLNWLSELHINKSDTLYILEKYDLRLEDNTPIFMASFWSKKNMTWKNNEIYSVQYSYIEQDNKFILSNERLFNGYILYLVNNWAIEDIKQEERLRSTISESCYMATRIIIQDQNWIYNIICFKDFSNFDKDKIYDLDLYK